MNLFKNIKSNNFNEYKDAYLKYIEQFLNINVLSLDIDNTFRPKLICQSNVNSLIEHFNNNKKNREKTIYGVRIDGESSSYNSKTFGRYFDVSKISFESLYKIYTDLYNIAKKLETDLYDKKTITSEILTLQQQDAKNIKTFEKVYDLFTLSNNYEYCDADKKWIFDRLRKDNEGNYYFIFNDNTSYSVEMIYLQQESSGKTGREILLESKDKNDKYNFWSKFLSYSAPLVKKWNEIILDIKSTYFSVDDISFEKTCMNNGVPRIYLESIDIIEKFIGYTREVTNDGIKEEKYFSYQIGTYINWKQSNKKSIQILNMRAILSSNLLQSVDLLENTKIKKIKRFSNNPNEIAIKHLPLPTYSNPKYEPKLPPWWSKFLEAGESKDGRKLPRFHNPINDLFKIACYVYNTLSAGYNGRQVYTALGAGADGKGTFSDVMMEIMGTDHAVAVKSSEYTEQFGLSGIINKKAIILPEVRAPGKLFNTEKFLSAVAGDFLSIEKKFQSHINYSTRGVTHFICTNVAFGLHGMETATRCLPCVWLRNYEDEIDSKSKLIAKDVMHKNLMSEKDEFLQWCVDYRFWLNEKYDRALLTGGDDESTIGFNVRLMSDEDLINRKYKIYTTEELFVRALDSMTLRGEKAVTTTIHEDLEAEIDYTYDLIDNLFELDVNKSTKGLSAKDIIEHIEKSMSISNLDTKRMIQKVFGNSIKSIQIDGIFEYIFNGNIYDKNNKIWRNFIKTLTEKFGASSSRTQVNKKREYRYNILIKENTTKQSSVDLDTLNEIERKLNDDDLIY